MNYFNNEQIQQILDGFTQEVKDTVELKENIPSECGASGTIAYGIKHYNMSVHRSITDNVYVEFDFESSVNEGDPSKIYESELREIEKELSNIFGYKVKASICVFSEGKEPDNPSPLYWGELEEPAIFRLTIKIYVDKKL